MTEDLRPTAAVAPTAGENRKFLEQVVPWPGPQDPGWINLHTNMKNACSAIGCVPGPQKRAACRALVAREVFAFRNPGMPPLPLSYAEREELKGKGGENYLVSVYARSLAAQKYRSTVHPGFSVYARGVMASPFAPDFIKQDQALLKRYPPRPLGGLGPGLCWRPTKLSR
jgi:hypothetical protein